MLATDIWGPIGAAAGVVAIIVAIVAAWWFARGPRLVMQASGTTLISAPGNPRISVLYDDERVNRVTQSIVWLWREGRGTLKGTDIVPADPITIHIPDGERILEAILARQSAETNVVTVEVSANRQSVSISFEYLESRQGAAIELYHTAPSPEAVTISGTVIGIPKGIKTIAERPTIALPVGTYGSVAVTLPTHRVPTSLRIGADPMISYRPSAPIRDAAEMMRRVLRGRKEQ